MGGGGGNNGSPVLTCSSCGSKLKEPYIRCAKCEDPTFLSCLKCFSKGRSKGKHESDHDYEIMRRDFSLWGDNWTAAEESQLLEFVDDCGLGNWTDVAKHVKKSPQECAKHYWQYYIESPQSPLTELPDQPLVNQPCIPIPYKASEDPPRPVLDSQRHAELAGYSAARGDFVTEYDNFSEMNLRDIEFCDEDDELDLQLKLVGVEMYNNQLRERARRKTIIRKFGLIDIRKTVMLWQQYENVIGKPVLNSLRPLMQLMHPEEFEYFLEGLHYEYELRQRIKHLQEYRKCGLTNFYSAKLYCKLKAKREEHTIKRTSMTDFITSWKNERRQTASEMQQTGSTSRRPAPPLDIMGLPGYEKLNVKERELCSLVRLVPDAFLEFKAVLINENQRNGCLRLAQARQLIKIDVNKTRKLYDFLVQEGLVNKTT